MKNLNFFSNKLALVAIVAVSSIMLMSFQNAGNKKLDYLTKIDVKSNKNGLATKTMLAIPGNFQAPSHIMDTVGGDDFVCLVPSAGCPWGGSSLTVSQSSYQTKMSKF